MKTPFKVISLIFLIAVSVLGAGCGMREGYEYANLSTFLEDQSDFLVIGKFQEKWPARVVLIQDGRDSITFTRADGQKHTYDGFAGYALKVVRLAHDKGEMIIVLRSKE